MNGLRVDRASRPVEVGDASTLSPPASTGAMEAMVKLIEVPLDGSPFGEQALPVALRLAEREHAELELVHVYETLPPSRTQGAPPIDPGLDEALRKDRASYLEGVAERLGRSTSVPLTATLMDGPVGPTLVAHVASRRAELVVLATHGRGGLSRAWLGSVASDIVRHASAPLLLVRPTERGPREQLAPAFRRVVVPLDGSPAGEEAIEHALAVAGDADVELLLVHVVLPIFYLTERAAQAFLDETELEAGAAAYLAGVATRVRARGVAADTRVLGDPQPARAILECVADFGADLIAMETHGRGGVARLLMGSVADKVARAAPVPVLLHRPSAPESSAAAGRGGAAPVGMR